MTEGSMFDFAAFTAECHALVAFLEVSAGHAAETKARRWFATLRRTWQSANPEAPPNPKTPAERRALYLHPYFAALKAKHAMNNAYYAFLKRNGPARARIAAEKEAQ